MTRKAIIDPGMLAEGECVVFFVVFCAVGTETEHRLKMVDGQGKDCLDVGGWALAANGGSYVLLLARSLAPPADGRA